MEVQILIDMLTRALEMGEYADNKKAFDRLKFDIEAEQLSLFEKGEIHD